MTCDVEHMMVKSMLGLNPLGLEALFLQTQYKYLGVAQPLKIDLALTKHTRVTKQDSKRLKHSAGSN